MRDLIRLPKVDLHVHLEGSIRPATLVELARRNGCPLPDGLDGGRYAWRDFDHFISQYATVCGALRTAEDFERIAYEFCEDEAGQGVRYAEVTFTALAHALRLDDWDTPTAAVLDGFTRGEEDFGVRCTLVLDHVRGFSEEFAELTLRTALRYRERGVVALGLGGHEINPPEPYARVFRRALAEGLHSVPHAGEAAGPESIRGAIHALGAERLGHGFRILEDDELVAQVRELAIPLEVCPTSNVATRLVPSLDEHPLPLLLDAGLVVTLNSDDPAMFESPLAGEYEAARRVHGLDDRAMAALARSGAQSSFAAADLKASLERDIDAWEAT